MRPQVGCKSVNTFFELNVKGPVGKKVPVPIKHSGTTEIVTREIIVSDASFVWMLIKISYGYSQAI